MKKIVFLMPQFKTGGGNRVFIELANKLVDFTSVKMIYPNNSTEGNSFSLDSRIGVIAVGSVTTSKFGKIANIVKTLSLINRKYKDAMIVIGDPMMATLIFLINTNNFCRFIQADDYNLYNDGMVISNPFFLKIYKRLTEFSYNLKLTYIFNSKFSFDQFVKIKNDKAISPIIVHPALNHDVFAVNHKLKTKTSKLQICLVGRKHPMKGLSTFIEAWDMLPNNIKSKIKKVVVMTHDDLDHFALDDFTIVYPNSDLEMASIYNESDIFISTSWWEGFGLPPLEAMACGCAVITSAAGGVNEYAIDNFNCRMFEPKDSECLVHRLIELIEDESKRLFISRNAIDTADKFTWDNSASELLKVIQ